MYGQHRELRFFQKSRITKKTQLEANFYVLEKSKSAETETIYDIESQKKENMAKKMIEYSTNIRGVKYQGEKFAFGIATISV